MEVNEKIAKRLLDLFFVPGSYYYEGPVKVEHKSYRHIKSPITIEKIISHVEGKISICAPSVHEDLAKWIIVDIDSDDIKIIAAAKSALNEGGFYPYVSCSGGKGYHIELFISAPTPYFTVRGISRQIKEILAKNNIQCDKVSPSPTGKGGDCIKLPLGVHPETGNQCHFLDDNLAVISSPLEFLDHIKTINIPGGSSLIPAVKPHVDEATGEIIEGSLPDMISPNTCVNKLWTEGLKQQGTRHSANCVIANAIVRSPSIPWPQKESAMTSWVNKTFYKAKSQELIKSATDMKYELEEALRVYRHYCGYSVAEHCENPVFKSAMMSACEDEFNCKLTQNHNFININLLWRLRIFNDPHAKPPGLGKTAMAVYISLGLLALDYQLFQWNGLPAFSTSTQQLKEMANCSIPSVIKHMNRLIETGLIVKIPESEVPRNIYERLSGYARRKIYALADITDKSCIKGIHSKLTGMH